jgi:hypothetical protein
MKNNLISLLASAGLTLALAIGAFAGQETNRVTIITFKVFDSPLVIRSDTPIGSGDPRASLPFVSLEFAYWKCTNWDQVLAIHTSSSIVVMDSLHMRESFEKSRAGAFGTNAYAQASTAYVHFQEGGQERMLAQSLPYPATAEDVAKISGFRVQGYTKVGDEWKIDKTLQTSEMGIFLVNSSHDQLKKIEEWVKATKQSGEQE